MPYKAPQNELKNISPSKVQNIVHSLNELYSLGRPKTDEECEERINQYFQFCENSMIRPGVESLCTSLHISRMTLFRWANGEDCSEKRREIIAGAKSFITAFLEQAALNGQINPATSIFLLKNWANYKDTVSFENTLDQTPKNKVMTAAELPKLSLDTIDVIDVKGIEME
jgi:hypothetical protein